MNEAQQFELFSRQHLRFPLKGLIETNHERKLSVPYVFCKP